MIYRTLKITWTQTDYEGSRTLRHVIHGWTHEGSTAKIERRLRAVVEVAVDIEKIVEWIAGNAAANRSGKSQLLRGLIRAKRIGYPEKLGESSEPVPLPAEHEEVTK